MATRILGSIKDLVKERTAEKTPHPSPLNLETPVGHWKAGLREWMIVLCFCVIGLVVSLDATILVPLLPTISNDLGGTSIDSFWTGTAYLLPCAVMQPLIVAASDIFGRRPLLLISILLFTAGTLICSLAQNFSQFLAGRSIQGIGGAGSICVPLSVLSDIIPLRERGMYSGVVLLTSAIGIITGPLVGGLFSQYTSWRWAFYINFPFCAVGLVMVLSTVRLRQKQSQESKFQSFDWFGGAIFIASSSSFLIGISWGGVQYPWASWHTICPIVLGMCGLLFTFLWEQLIATNPFFRTHLFGDISAIAAYVGVFLQGLLLFCELYYIPLYLESVQNLSSSLTGVGVLPITCAVFPVSSATAYLITTYGHYRWPIWAGWVVIVISTSLLLLFNTTINTHAWIIILATVGIGHGLIFTALSVCVQALADPKDVSYAAGMYTFVRTFGMCIGVPVGGTVFQNQFKYHLHKLNLPDQIAEDVEGYIVQLKELPMTSTKRQVLNLAYAQSFQDVFKVLIGASILGGFLSMFIRHATLDRQLESEQRLENGTA